MKKHIMILIAISIISIAIFASAETVSAASEPKDCITFTSSEQFTVTLGESNLGNTWDGIVQVSVNGKDWDEYMAGQEVSATKISGKYKVFFRGEGNHHISDCYEVGKWSSFTLPRNCSVACSGNIENLLDYLVVKSGSHPEMYDKAFCRMFSGCESLTTAPELPATTLAPYCYYSMFASCRNLTKAPALPAETLTDSCYFNMFLGCESLINPPKISAQTLASECCFCMFYNCKNLKTAPELPATTLAPDCYEDMFLGCISMTTAPALPATTLASRCYGKMFGNCTSLTTAPELPATTLEPNCYYQMFDGCTSLTKAPELPAITLAESCYSYMFKGCTSLKMAPALPAETLTNFCYNSMFENCSSLTRPPALPATTLVKNCYSSMFRNSGLMISSEEGTFDGVTYSIPYRIPEGGNGATPAYSLFAMTNMFKDTKGPFTGDPTVNQTYYLPDVTGIPFTTMKAKGKKSMTITWEPVDGADGYEIFFAKCSKKKDNKESCKLVKTIEGNNVTQWTKTGLKKKTAYKAYVRAYVLIDEPVYKESSPLMHAYTSGGTSKYTNAKSVSLKTTEVTLTESNTFTLKPKVNKLKKSKKLMPKKHVKTIRYTSTNTGVATVSSKGKITAIGSGECYVYVYAHNGVFKKVKVIVE